MATNGGFPHAGPVAAGVAGGFPGLALEICLAAVALIGLIFFIIPLLFDIARRAWHHGPAPSASPGGSGAWLGWAVSVFWSMRERNREELYEHMRDMSLQRTTAAQIEADDAEAAAIVHPPVDLPPTFRHDPAPAEPPVRLARNGPTMSPDSRWWWDGRGWHDTERYVPVGARMSGDGSRWWDGTRWRISPSRMPQLAKALPRKAPWTPPDHETETWLSARGVSMSPQRETRIRRPHTQHRSSPSGFPPVQGPPRPRP